MFSVPKGSETSSSKYQILKTSPWPRLANPGGSEVYAFVCMIKQEPLLEDIHNRFKRTCSKNCKGSLR